MRVSIFGAGYVGSVSGACLAELGHSVTVVDVNAKKVDLIARGQAPIVEAGLPELISKNVSAGRLRATTDHLAAIEDGDVSIICVGTPSTLYGNLDLSYVRKVSEEIGHAMRLKRKSGKRHTVVVRSTMLPGSVRNVVVPTLEEAAGMVAGKDFLVAIYPEFLRESTAIEDFFAPALNVFGVDHEEALAVLRTLTEKVNAEEVVVSTHAAEAVKYANNAWHAVKITFANEVGNLCKAAGIDGHEVMSILCRDRRLNISPAYLRPGYAFGGSCLPKDLRALRKLGASLDVPTPLFDATLSANEVQVRKALEMVEGRGHRRISMFGLTFKSGTDDLRESPLVELAERLLGKGYQLKIYDRDLKTGLLIGSNLEYITSRLRHLSDLMSSGVEEALEHGQTLIVGKNDAEVRQALLEPRPEKFVVDLVRLDPRLRSNGHYEGICW